MELFGYYFPPEIINWFCDDWINNVYKELKSFFPLTEYTCVNKGGEPRYQINNQIYNNRAELNTQIKNMKQICDQLVERDIKRISIVNVLK